MDLGLGGRVAVVTAAGSGIGLACARLLVSEGAHVVAGDIALDELKRLEGPGSIIPVAVDLLKPEAAGELAKVAVDRFGAVDILVNNFGGAAVRESFRSVDDDAWAAMLNRNLMAMVRVCRAVLPSMIERKRGAIVNIASTSGSQPDPFMVDYCAAKSAVLSVTKSLSIEFGPVGIRANSVSPGPTRTPALLRSIGTTMAAKWGMSTEDALAHYATNVHHMPVGRIGAPADVAAVVGFLASDAARQVTGAEYLVDGGFLKAY